MDYWAKKEKNKKEAEIHTKTMNAIYSDKIRVCIKETKLFDHMTPMQASEPQQKPDTIIVQTDVVTAAYKYHKGKTAVLNFASYKNPGGMFIKGSSAQEESLCHESFLYNVLQEFDHTYYEWNTASRFSGTTQDKVFCLSYLEARTLLTPQMACCEPSAVTSKSKNKILVEKNNGRAYCYWWLRTSVYKNNAGCVSPAASFSNAYEHFHRLCVRPALWVDASAVTQ